MYSFLDVQNIKLCNISSFVKKDSKSNLIYSTQNKTNRIENKLKIFWSLYENLFGENVFRFLRLFRVSFISSEWTLSLCRSGSKRAGTLLFSFVCSYNSWPTSFGVLLNKKQFNFGIHQNLLHRFIRVSYTNEWRSLYFPKIYRHKNIRCKNVQSV